MGKEARSQPAPEGSWILEGAEEDLDGNSWSSTSETEHPADNVAAVEASGKTHGSSKNPSPRSRAPSNPVPKTRLRPLHGSQHAEPALVMPSMKAQSASSPRGGGENSAPRLRKTVVSKSRNTQHDSPTTVTANSSKGLAKPHVASQDPLLVPALVWTHFLFPVLQFVGAVLSLLYRMLKPLLILIAAVWLLGFLARLVFLKTMSRALAPLCLLPGSTYVSNFCAGVQSSSPVAFDELVMVQSAFEDVLSTSANGVNLPLDMKRGEASIRDLKHVVQYSALPSRSELVFEFTGFIETARQASGDLTRFNSRIGRAVDRVIGINRWTLQILDGVAEKEASRGLVNRFLETTVLAPFNYVHAPETVVLEQYLQHTRAVEEQIAELIIEAQALLAILQNLDDRLDVIQGISTRDGLSIKGDGDDLLVQLWTWVGGNRASVKKNYEQKELLNQVNTYRKTAWEHVSGTILKLQAIAGDLEDLRERVGAPEVLGVGPESLRMHIEHIQMGVERLEEKRSESRTVEGTSYRRILDKPDAGDGGRVLLNARAG